MNTIETMRLLSDGRMSVHDVRSLLMSMGHSRQDCADAFMALFDEPGSELREGRYQKGEFYAELYLTPSVDSTD